MSQTYHEEDEPIFKGQKESSTTERERLKTERLIAKEENRRKNKIIDFAKTYLGWIIAAMMLLIILELISQKFELDNSLIKEGFSLFQYSVTIIIGFMFADGNK